MFKYIFAICLFVLANIHPRPAIATPVTLVWEGIITGTDARNGALPFSLPFTCSIGTIVYGTIHYDTNEPGLIQTTTLVEYDSHNTITIGKFDFLPTTDTRQLWLYNNDVSLHDGVTGYDQFQSFFVNDSFAPGYGVDGGMTLQNQSADAFSSLALPTNINMSAFPTRYWSLWLHGEGSSESTAPSIAWYGPVTAIGSVPEPDTIFLFAPWLVVSLLMGIRKPA